MKKSKCISALIILSFFTVSFTDFSVYDFYFNTMDDSEHYLEEFRGKEILIAILPVERTSNDSSFLVSLKQVGAAHTDSLAVIGIPSYEYGYMDESKDSLFAWYSSIAENSILLSKGMHTDTIPALTQHPLFTWLTNEEQNGHFGKEVTGATQCFFISPEGALHIVTMPGGAIDEALIKAALKGNVTE